MQVTPPAKWNRVMKMYLLKSFLSKFYNRISFSLDVPTSGILYNFQTCLHFGFCTIFIKLTTVPLADDFQGPYPNLKPQRQNLPVYQIPFPKLSLLSSNMTWNPSRKKMNKILWEIRKTWWINISNTRIIKLFMAAINSLEWD